MFNALKKAKEAFIGEVMHFEAKFEFLTQIFFDKNKFTQQKQLCTLILRTEKLDRRISSLKIRKQRTEMSVVLY